MITFDIPTITTAQRLATMSYEMMRQSAEVHNSGQYVSFNELEPEDVRQVYIEGLAKNLMEIDLPATRFFPSKRYLVASIYCRFDGMHLSEIKFFSKHYETR